MISKSPGTCEFWVRRRTSSVTSARASLSSLVTISLLPTAVMVTGAPGLTLGVRFLRLSGIDQLHHLEALSFEGLYFGLVLGRGGGFLLGCFRLGIGIAAGPDHLYRVVAHLGQHVLQGLGQGGRPSLVQRDDANVSALGHRVFPNGANNRLDVGNLFSGPLDEDHIAAGVGFQVGSARSGNQGTFSGGYRPSGRLPAA